MNSPKWYEVPEDQERAVIRKKRKEWFPKTEEKDWEILGLFYSWARVQKREFSILMKEAIKFFYPSTASEVIRFCSKFDHRIIFAGGDPPNVQIGDPGYLILIKESFADLRETKYWLPDLELLLIESQTDTQNLKTEYSESEIRSKLSDYESSRMQESIVRSGRPGLIRQPKLNSFIVSGVAHCHFISSEKMNISIQKKIIGQDSEEWYKNFFKNRMDVFEPPSLPIAKPKSVQQNILPKNKIFISCGQYHEHERALGKKLADLVNKHTTSEGYFAQNQTSLSGLSDNIFNELNNCSGLVVVMHSRGSVTSPEGKTIVRASVWIEQEIAIAAFLKTIQEKNIEVILYAENGVSLEGVRTQLQLNPIQFNENAEVEKHFEQLLVSKKFNSSASQAEEKEQEQEL